MSSFFIHTMKVNSNLNFLVSNILQSSIFSILLKKVIHIGFKGHNGEYMLTESFFYVWVNCPFKQAWQKFPCLSIHKMFIGGLLHIIKQLLCPVQGFKRCNSLKSMMFLKTSILKTLLTLRDWKYVWIVPCVLLSFRRCNRLTFISVLSLYVMSPSLSVSCSFGHGTSRPPVSCSVRTAEGHLHLHQPGSSALAAIRRRCRGRGGWRTHRVSDIRRHVTGQNEDLCGHLHQSPQVSSSF